MSRSRTMPALWREECPPACVAPPAETADMSAARSRELPQPIRVPLPSALTDTSLFKGRTVQ